MRREMLCYVNSCTVSTAGVWAAHKRLNATSMTTPYQIHDSMTSATIVRSRPQALCSVESLCYCFTGILAVSARLHWRYVPFRDTSSNVNDGAVAVACSRTVNGQGAVFQRRSFTD